MEFEWDENKRAANIRKHEIDFVDAVTMWRGPVVNLYQKRFFGSEWRIVALGRPQGSETLVAKIYTVRNERIRIISVRKARRDERADYNRAVD